jgi:hypothetical protein
MYSVRSMPETTTAVALAAFATSAGGVALEAAPQVRFVESDEELAHVDAAAASTGDLTILTAGLSTR